jgi:hypothetical protein
MDNNNNNNNNNNNHQNEDKLVDLILKFKEADEKAKLYEARAKKYKQKIRQVMDSRGERTLRLPNWVLRLSLIKRAMMPKAQIPTEIWDQYAVQTQHETLYIRAAPRKKTR